MNARTIVMREIDGVKHVTLDDFYKELGFVDKEANLLQRKLDRAMRFLSTIEEHSCEIDEWVVDESCETRREIEDMK